MERVPADVRTVYLGQFTPEHASRIGHELETRGITWWTKDPGFISRIWELGVRLFVDRARLDEARTVAAAVLGNLPGPDAEGRREEQ